MIGDRKLLTIIAFLLCSFISFATPTGGYNYFRHINTYGKEINCIYRDPATGIVWLGSSYGLIKYGESTIDESISRYPGRLNSAIRTIMGLKDNMLLIRTLSSHYIVYDPDNNRIVLDDFDGFIRAIGIEGAEDVSTEIMVDGENLWIYTGRKLYSHPQSKEGKAVLQAIADDTILYAFISRDRFYILTARTLSMYDKKTSGLIKRLDWTFPVDVRNLKIVEDCNGDLWIGNENLYRYNLRNEQCLELGRNLSVTDMAVSKEGTVFVATNTRGLVTYDELSGCLVSIAHDPNNADKLKSNRLKALFIDEDNNLWTSYSKQGMSISSSSYGICNMAHVTSINKRNERDDIISLTYDENGDLWLGTEGYGLFNSGITDMGLLPDIVPNSSNEDNSVTSTFLDSNGNLWIGIYRKGLFFRKGKSWKMFLDGMSPYSIVEDHSGNIFVGTLRDGLFRLSPENGYVPDPIKVGNAKYIPSLSYDGDRTAYVATSSGLAAVDTETCVGASLTGNRKGTEMFSAESLLCVFCDSRGLIWLVGSGVTDSIEIFNPEDDTILQVPTPESFKNSIIEDDNRNIWISSDEGVINVLVNNDYTNGGYRFSSYLYNPVSNDVAFRHFNNRAVAKSPEGLITFGSTNGYITINPAAYAFYQEGGSNKTDIVSLKINNDLVSPGFEYNGRIILNKDLSATSSISLKHNENNLTFLVHSQDYSSPFETTYYYSIKCLGDNWYRIYDHTIDINNIPVGTYTLSIARKKPDGTLAEPSTSLDICINAPWYRTVLAYILYTLILLALIVAILYYFSERKSQQLKLEQAENEIHRQAQLNEMKLRFFTNISHDFRTPLTLIITPLEAYLNDKDKNPDVKFFTPIYKNAVRLLQLVNQILDFRKLDVYGDTLNLSNGDIVLFVRNVCDSFTSFAEDNKIDIHFSSSNPSLNMAFDSDKLTKIMMNLLSNAFKHTPQGGSVQVRVEIVYDSLNISVIDNGCGVPDKDKESIFQRFYQRNADNSANMGSGIGLHIVKEFVTLHKGTITVTDNVPKGACFTFSLPITQCQEAQPDEREEENVTYELEAIDGKRYTLLLVEDNAEFLDFLSQSLSDEYSIIKAENGLEALKQMEKNSVDLVVSDVMMDKMDGLELCHRIKTDINYSHIPLILLTAKSMVEDEIQGFEDGADDYITKPFNLSVLKLRIHTLLKLKEQYRKEIRTKLEINPSEVTITSLDEQFLSAALKAVEGNIGNPDFSVEDLSAALNMHRSHLYRKLLGITGKTPIEFIRLVRLKRAKQYLAQSQMYIAEIAYQVGFNSPKLFAKYFKDEFGETPSQYKDHFSDNINKTHIK